MTVEQLGKIIEQIEALLKEGQTISAKLQQSEEIPPEFWVDFVSDWYKNLEHPKDGITPDMLSQLKWVYEYFN